MHFEPALTSGDLAAQCEEVLDSCPCAGQVKLKAQQSMLQKRLQQALQMHLQPRTSVNTESPADRTLRLLDSLLQVWSVQ